MREVIKDKVQPGIAFKEGKNKHVRRTIFWCLRYHRFIEKNTEQMYDPEGVEGMEGNPFLQTFYPYGIIFPLKIHL